MARSWRHSSTSVSEKQRALRGGKEGAVREFYQTRDDGGIGQEGIENDVKLDFQSATQNLPAEWQAALRKLDTNGDGSVSVSVNELLYSAKKKEMKRLYISLASSSSCCSLLSLALHSSPQRWPRQETESQARGGFLQAAGKVGQILRTAAADKDLLLPLVPLFSPTQVGSIQSITLGPLTRSNTTEPCDTCPVGVVTLCSCSSAGMVIKVVRGPRERSREIESSSYRAGIRRQQQRLPPLVTYGVALHACLLTSP